MSESVVGALPSLGAIAQLRELARALDVEDLVDLCYARAPDNLRISIYADSLRGRAGDQAQVASCLLLFDLARRGDACSEMELALLMPVIDELIEAEELRMVGRVSALSRLVDSSAAAAELWLALSKHAQHRDRRAAATPAPPAIEAIEFDLFDDEELAELCEVVPSFDVDFEFDLGSSVNDDYVKAFAAAVDRLVPEPPLLLFASDTRSDLERAEALRDVGESFGVHVRSAREIAPLAGLFLSSHTRGRGFFGRRNKDRDAVLHKALTAFLLIAEPPAEGASWFGTSDVIPVDPEAWPKMAEILIDFSSWLGNRPDAATAEANDVASVEALVNSYISDPRSAAIKPVLAGAGHERRRRQR